MSIQARHAGVLVTVAEVSARPRHPLAAGGGPPRRCASVAPVGAAGGDATRGHGATTAADPGPHRPRAAATAWRPAPATLRGGAGRRARSTGTFTTAPAAAEPTRRAPPVERRPRRRRPLPDVRGRLPHLPGRWPSAAADLFLFVGDTDLRRPRVQPDAAHRRRLPSPTTLEQYRAKHRYNRADAAVQDFLRAHGGVRDLGRPRGAEQLRRPRRAADAGRAPRVPRLLARSTAARGARPALPLGALGAARARSSSWTRGSTGAPTAMPDGPGKSMLGAAQRRWLLDGVGAPTATWKLVVSRRCRSACSPGGPHVGLVVERQRASVYAARGHRLRDGARPHPAHAAPRRRPQRGVHRRRRAPRRAAPARPAPGLRRPRAHRRPAGGPPRAARASCDRSLADALARLARRSHNFGEIDDRRRRTSRVRIIDEPGTVRMSLQRTPRSHHIGGLRMIELTLAMAEQACAGGAAEGAGAAGADDDQIVDEAGRLVLCARGDGTGFFTPETSRPRRWRRRPSAARPPSWPTLAAKGAGVLDGGADGSRGPGPADAGRRGRSCGPAGHRRHRLRRRHRRAGPAMRRRRRGGGEVAGRRAFEHLRSTRGVIADALCLF